MNFLTNRPGTLLNISSDPGPSNIYCYLALVDVPGVLLLTRVIVHIKNSECTLCINVCQDCPGMQNTEHPIVPLNQIKERL